MSRAYDFLAERYRPGDKIYIFGYSRGAYAARALCGVLAYAGLYDATAQPREVGEGVWKKVNAMPHAANWSDKACAERRAEVAEGLGVEPEAMRPAKVQFLGIFDTVPAVLGGRDYDAAGRPGPGTRRFATGYKTLGYPNTRQIAHVMSIHESRGPFIHQSIAQPIDPRRTRVDEVWFAGDHRDIAFSGQKMDDLGGITFEWMLNRVAPESLRGFAPSSNGGNPHAMRGDASLSLCGILGARAFGVYAPRKSERKIPEGAVIHRSYLAHKANHGDCTKLPERWTIWERP